LLSLLLLLSQNIVFINQLPLLLFWLSPFAFFQPFLS